MAYYMTPGQAPVKLESGSSEVIASIDQLTASLLADRDVRNRVAATKIQEKALKIQEKALDDRLRAMIAGQAISQASTAIKSLSLSIGKDLGLLKFMELEKAKNPDKVWSADLLERKDRVIERLDTYGNGNVLYSEIMNTLPEGSYMQSTVVDNALDVVLMDRVRDKYIRDITELMESK